MRKYRFFVGAALCAALGVFGLQPAVHGGGDAVVGPAQGVLGLHAGVNGWGDAAVSPAQGALGLHAGVNGGGDAAVSPAQGALRLQPEANDVGDAASGPVQDAYSLQIGSSGLADPSHNPPDLFRLHFIANSDAAYDQAVKLHVRDGLLPSLQPALSGASTAREAMLIAQSMGAELEAQAERALVAGGVGYGALLVIGEMDFEARELGGVLLPAGRYPALRLELGEAKGRNWWCVLYPSLCAEAGVSPQAEDGEAGFHSLIWDWFISLPYNDKVED